MVSYFARHEVDKQGQGWSPGEPGYPSAGRIAWALWGGDAGRAWAERTAKRLASDSPGATMAKPPKRVRADLGVDDVHVPAAVGGKRKRRRSRLSVRIGADHSVEIRHAGDASPDGVLCREAIELADAAQTDAPVWIQIAKVGAFRGHPAGPFALTPEVFDEIVRNFRATSNRAVPIDFEHASEADPTSGSVPVVGAPAQGWIRDLDNRGAAGLWGLVEWLPQARQYIRDGAYRYLSPAIRFGSRDRVTGAQIGARLTSAALTNQPFLDGMAALAAKDKPMTHSVPHGAIMPALRAALRLDELAPPADMKAKLSNLRGACMAASDPLGVHEGVDLGAYVSALRTCVNAPATWQLGELFDAIESLIHAAIERHELEMHGPHDEADEDDDPAAMADRAPNNGATTMADENTISLKDHETAIATMRADAASLTLKLTAAEKRLADLEAENVTLKDAEQKRLCAEQEREVDETISVYGDTKGLTPVHRPTLLTLLRADAAGFRAMYPRVEADKRHLLTNVSQRAGQDAPQPGPLGAPIDVAAEIRALTDKGVSLADACLQVERRARALAV